MATFETITSLAPEAVLEAAQAFFALRVPATAAFPETASSRHVVLRGQGGEEIVIGVLPVPGGTAVRGSSQFFGQQVKRFFTTLPLAGRAGAA